MRKLAVLLLAFALISIGPVHARSPRDKTVPQFTSAPVRAASATDEFTLDPPETESASHSKPAASTSLTQMLTDPPIAARIDVGTPNAQGWTTITGQAGAVAPDSVVAVACLDSATVEFVRATSDGRFQARLFAPPGTAIEVKHAYLEVPLAEIETTFGGTTSGDIMVGWMNATAGTILLVPLPALGQGGNQAFGFAGTVHHEGGQGFWSLQGTYGPGAPSASGLQFPISGTLIVTTTALSGGMDLSSVRADALVQLRRHYDQDGRQAPLAQAFYSNFLTPTGLPIWRDGTGWSPVEASGHATGWQQASDNTLRATLSMTLTVPGDLRPGHYIPRLSLRFSGIPLGTPTKRSLRPGFIYGDPTSSGNLPLTRIGSPDAPRLTWTLLTDTLHNGSRGVLAREDRPDVGQSTLTVFQAQDTVVPRVDPRTGQPIAYRLEPFLPLVALADRGTPNPPLIPFDLPSGSLTVRIRAPDGSVETLGPAPFVQSTGRTPSFPDGKVRDNDGGALQEAYQLLTMRDAFAHTFDQYGHHVITLEGQVRDIWGNLHRGSGTYDLHVARPLKLESGQLPTTPYQVDNFFTAGLHVYPPMPAEVKIHLVHMPHSNPDEAIEHVIVGQANRFGYLAQEALIPMTHPGEYRVDITASHRDEDGVLWMGSATWGGVVEGPNPVLVAHGRRGLDVPQLAPMLWFYHEALNFEEIAHTFYPYYTGDVFWGIDLDMTADSILPAISIQDTRGEIYQIIQQRWNQPHPLLYPFGTLADRIARDAAPLVSTTSDGSDPLWSPERVDQYGYAYRSSQRPDVRVHETVSEEGMGIGYWRYGASYGDQAGYEGDVPNDLKWQFGGAVFRVLREREPINEYAIYGSMWVLLPDDDPLRGRVTPPFQGTTGGPDGGPILTLKGQEIDLLFLPRGVQPGDMLETGDRFTFSGHVGPPLDSRVAFTVTSPSGEAMPFVGRANKVGWFYDPGIAFPLEEPGLWTVQVRVVHDSSIPSGGTPSGHNTGTVLGTADGRYPFYVVDRGSPRLDILSPQPGYLSWPTAMGASTPVTVTQVPIVASIPAGLSDVKVSYTIRMPGFLLEQGSLYPTGSTFTVLYDPLALNADYPNLDLKSKDADQPGLADPVQISLLLSGRQSGRRVHHAGAVFLNGEDVQIPGRSQFHALYLPLVMGQQ